jgi:hypothetical protein
MLIHGIDNLTLEDIEREVELGARFVFYEYCISLIVVSARRPSAIYYLPADDWGVVRGLRYCLLTLLFGWWGIPWGLVYSPLTLFNNLGGGCDVTDEVLTLLRTQAESRAPEPEPEGRIPCDES